MLLREIFTFRVELVSDIFSDDTFGVQLSDVVVIEIRPTLPSEDISHQFLIES